MFSSANVFFFVIANFVVLFEDLNSKLSNLLMRGWRSAPLLALPLKMIQKLITKRWELYTWHQVLKCVITYPIINTAVALHVRRRWRPWRLAYTEVSN